MDYVHIFIPSNVSFFPLLLPDNWWNSCVQRLMRVVYYSRWVRYNILSNWCVICPLESWLFQFKEFLRIDEGPEWVKFPCSCPSFRLSCGYSCLKRLGLFAALAPLRHFIWRMVCPLAMRSWCKLFGCRRFYVLIWRIISLFLFLSHPFTTISNNVAWFFTIVACHICLFSVLLVFIWGYGCRCG